MLTLQHALDRLTLNNQRSAEDIADHLRSLGIHGKPCSAGKCPAARYLTQHVGRDIFIDGACAVAANEDESVETPFELSVFINEFDDGLHDYLLE